MSTNRKGPETVYFPDPVTGPWEARLKIGEVHGRPVCVGLEIALREGEEAQPLTSSIMRTLRLGAVTTSPAKAGFNGAYAQGAVIPRISARGPYPPEHFQAVARAYEAAWEAGVTSPTQHVANAFRTTRPAAAKWVARCRDMGLLPPATPGRAQGGGTS